MPVPRTDPECLIEATLVNKDMRTSFAALAVHFCLFAASGAAGAASAWPVDAASVPDELKLFASRTESILDFA